MRQRSEDEKETEAWEHDKGEKMQRNRDAEDQALATLLQALSQVLYDTDGTYDLTGEWQARAEGAAASVADNVRELLTGERWYPSDRTLADEIRHEHQQLTERLAHFRAEQAAAGEPGPKARRARYEAEKQQQADWREAEAAAEQTEAMLRGGALPSPIPLPDSADVPRHVRQAYEEGGR